MADIKSPKERSQNMAKIHSKDTKPEVWFRKKLFAKGYRYRKHVSTLPGHPDLWLAKHRTAVFVNGCFWHRHKGCKYAYMPKSRVQFWENKFKNNIERDEKNNLLLNEKGIKVLIIWECSLKKMKKSKEHEEYIMDAISVFLNQNDQMLIEF